MKKFYLNLFRANWPGLFILYFLVSFLVNYFNDEFVVTDELYYQHLEQEYDEKYKGYEEFGNDLNDLEFLDESDEISFEDLFYDFLYILLHAIITIPILAMLFSSGFFLTSDLSHVKYRAVFKAVLLSSFVFLFELIIKSLYFLFIDTDYSFADVSAFRPFHLSSLYNTEEVASWIFPFLDLINLYEIIFLLSVSYLISYLYRKGMSYVLIVTSVTYFVANIIWELFLFYLISIF